jgi:hypothetical protein
LFCVFSISRAKGKVTIDSRPSMFLAFPSSMQEEVVRSKPNPYEEQRNQNV